MGATQNQRSQYEFTPQARRAFVGLAGATACGITTYAFLSGSILSMYLDRLGFTPFLIGLLAFLLRTPALLQIMAARYYDRHGCRTMLIRLFILAPILLLPFVAAPQLGQWFGRWAMVAGIFAGLIAYAASDQWAAAGWLPLLRHNLPECRRVESIGTMNQMGMLCSIVVICLCAALLEEHTPIPRFQLIILVGAVFVALKIPFMALAPIEDIAHVGGPHRNSLRRDLLQVWGNTGFRRVAIYVSLAYFAVGIHFPFIALYIKKLGFSDRFTLLATVPLGLAATALFERTWGRLADRFGSRAVYVLSGIGASIGFLLLAVPPGNSFASAVFVALIIIIPSLFWPGMRAASMLRMFKVVPRENQSLHMCFYHIGMIFFLALGSLVGGSLIKLATAVLPDNPGITLIEYRILLIASAVLILIGTWYTRTMRDLKEMSSPHLLRHLRRRTKRRIAGTLGRLRRKPKQDTS